MNNYIGIFIRKTAHAIGLAVIFAMTFLVILNSDVKATSPPSWESFTNMLIWNSTLNSQAHYGVIHDSQKQDTDGIDKGIPLTPLVSVDSKPVSEKSPGEEADYIKCDDCIIKVLHILMTLIGSWLLGFLIFFLWHKLKYWY